MALAALGPEGFRGNRVQIPAADLPSVKRKVLAAWREVHDKDEEVPEILKQQGELGMTQEELTAQMTQLENDIAALTKRAEDAEFQLHITKLDAPMAEAYESLSSEEKEAYRAADAATREQILAKAAEKLRGDDVVPEQLQKRLDDIQKRLDEEVAKREAAEALAKRERDAREMQEMIKRAETEFAGLPGTAEEKGAVLKSLTKLTSEEQEAITKLLKAGNACLLQGMTSRGSDAVGKGVSDSWGEIEKRAEAWVREGKYPTLAKAVAALVEKEPQLYEAYLQEQPKQTGN
jgi:chromosome segregation ATPase